MVYLIQAKTHFQYALPFWRDLHLEKRRRDSSLYLNVFSCGLKALYNLLNVSPQRKSLFLEKIILKIYPHSKKRRVFVPFSISSYGVG